MIYKSEADCCRDALQVQDACNIGGVSHSYHEVLVSLRNAKGWDVKLGSHPAVVLFQDKLDDMLGRDASLRAGTDAYTKAFVECTKIVAKDDEATAALINEAS